MPKRWVIIFILGALDTITPLTIDMYLPAFSGIAEQFGSTTARVSLSLTSYFLGFGVAQIFYGPLLDRFGRHRPITWGLMLYILASIGCMFSTTVETLIAFRFLQAFGGSAAAVGVRAMVRDYFNVAESPKIFSIMMLILAVSPLLAPALGSLITMHFAWPWIFAVLAVIAALILIAMHVMLPEKYHADPSVSLAPRPMIQTFLSILRNRNFATYTIATAFTFGALSVYLAGSTVILLGEFNLSGSQYAILFALQSIGLVAGNQLNLFLFKRFKPEKTFRVALILQLMSALTFFAMAYIGWHTVTSTIVFFFIQLACLGLTFPNGSALGMAPFSKDLGSASALMGFMHICIGGAVSAIVGIANMDSTLPIAGMLLLCSALALLSLLIGRPRHNEIVAKSKESGNL